MAANVPLVAADHAEACKLNKYGPIAPHILLPFVVEHAGALGKAATEHFKRCMKRCVVSNPLSGGLGMKEVERSSWSSWGFSNYNFQRISLANVKGVGHYFQQVARVLASLDANAAAS